MQYNKLSTPFFIAALFFAAGFWSGCVVDYDVEEDDHQFYCEEDDDCIDGYVCDEDENFCVEDEPDEPDEGPPCDDSEDGIDQDGDGYGTGSDRSNCGPPERDCDDSDPDVYPGAPELCDDKANDCGDWPDDGEPGEDVIDDFSCETLGDCGDFPAEDGDEYDGLTAICSDDNVCVLRPVSSGSPDCDDSDQMTLRCETSEETGEKQYLWELQGEEKTAEDVPDACR